MLLKTELLYVTRGYENYAPYYENIVRTLLLLNPPPSDSFPDAWRIRLMSSISQTLTPDVYHTDHSSPLPSENFLRANSARVTFQGGSVRYDPFSNLRNLYVPRGREVGGLFLLRYIVRAQDSYMLVHLEMKTEKLP